MPFRVAAAITLALGVTCHSSMKAFTVLFLALGFFAVAHLLLRCVLTPVLSNHSHALHFFVILVRV